MHKLKLPIKNGKDYEALCDKSKIGDLCTPHNSGVTCLACKEIIELGTTDDFDFYKHDIEADNDQRYADLMAETKK